MTDRAGRIVVHTDADLGIVRPKPYWVEIVWDDDENKSPWASMWFATKEKARIFAADYAREAGIPIIDKVD